MQKSLVKMIVLVIIANIATACAPAVRQTSTPTPAVLTQTAAPTKTPTPPPPPAPIANEHSDWEGVTMSALCLEIGQSSNVAATDMDRTQTEEAFFLIVGDMVKGLGMKPVFDDSVQGMARYMYSTDTTECDATLSISIARQSLSAQYRRENEYG